ncbi:MAG: MmgE/PrpD family protein, partial [Alphaproteobacteria bacterium]
RPDETIGATRRLARFAAGLGYEDLDAATRHAARRHILDTLGACLAGSGQSVTETAEAVLVHGLAACTVPVPGRRRRADAPSAAYLGGAAGHGLELDDGYRPGSVHPGCVVVPAALAAGYVQGASGPALLTAVAAGYEVVARIAAAAQPGLRRRGFHATGACGAFGAAAAVGGLRGLDAAAMENAFGLAASAAGGLFAFVGGGAEVKRLHAGQAARGGLLAALMAERGIAGPPNVLECPDGFFQAFAGGDATPIDEIAGRDGFAIAQCYIKPYACCRHFHGALDALFEILDAEELDPAAVEKVEVGTYAFAAAHGATGWDSMATAQLSFPFVMATALHARGVRPEHFSAACRGDPAVTADCAKIAVFVDADCEARYPRLRPAKVTLHASGGRCFTRAVDEPLGAQRNPLDDGALGDKYLGLAGPVLGAARARETLALLWRLDELDTLAGLCDALAG